MLKKTGIVLFYVGLWQLVSFLVANPLMVPSVMSVLSRLVLFLLQPLFWTSLMTTLLRVLMGTMISFALAFALAFASYRLRWIEAFLQPILMLTKTLPNITYILLVLVWFSRETSVAMVSFLVVFPVIYGQLYGGLLAIEQDHLDVLKIYPESLKTTLLNVWLPLIEIHIIEALVLALSLGFKVGVMAEILGQVQPGLGYLFYTAKTNFEIADLFALSLAMLAVVTLFEKGLRLWMRKD